jgi:3-hydroxyacyl-[acyl-carrier-protein] dehydratase
MLTNDFYTIRDLYIQNNTITAALLFNASHKIFEGHFPGQPVVPGVCMMALVKEIMAMVTEEDLRLLKADDLKFLKVIDPRENQEIKLQAQYKTSPEGNISVTANLAKEEGVCFKFRGTFQIVNNTIPTT